MVRKSFAILLAAFLAGGILSGCSTMSADEQKAQQEALAKEEARRKAAEEAATKARAEAEAAKRELDAAKKESERVKKVWRGKLNK